MASEQGVLAGKVALVTGAGRGIGREIARRLARDGARLVVHYCDSEDGAAATAQTIREQGGEAVTLRADVSQLDEVKALFRAIDAAFGRLDIVVNSAGISGGGKLAELDVDQVDRLLGVNLKGPLYVASEAAKRLGEGGRIVNIGSTMSEFPIPSSGVYSAAKAAVKSFTESWARELGLRGVTVNTVIPGATVPGMAENTPEPFREMYLKASPFGRLGRAEEIAAAVGFLVSPEASWVSGAHILANGAGNA